MADTKVSALDTLGSIDRTADYLYIVDATGPTSNKMTVNAALGFSGGNPVSTSDSQTLTNKTLTTPTITVLDNALTIQDNSDATKQLQLQLSGITTGTTRTLTVPDASTTLVGTDTTQTLTNKTLTSPTINTPTITNPTLTVNTISEYTAANGVTIDGLLIKDGLLPAGNIQPLNLMAGTGSTWVWQSWTSTLSAATGVYTSAAISNSRYTQIGKTILYTLIITITTVGTGGSPIFTLPGTARASFGLYGAGRVVGGTSSGKMLQVAVASTTAGSVLTYDNTSPASDGATVYISGFYEAA